MIPNYRVPCSLASQTHFFFLREGGKRESGDSIRSLATTASWTTTRSWTYAPITSCRVVDFVFFLCCSILLVTMSVAEYTRFLRQWHDAAAFSLSRICHIS